MPLGKGCEGRSSKTCSTVDALNGTSPRKIFVEKLSASHSVREARRGLRESTRSDPIASDAAIATSRVGATAPRGATSAPKPALADPTASSNPTSIVVRVVSSLQDALVATGHLSAEWPL